MRRTAMLLLAAMVAAGLMFAHPSQAEARTVMDAHCDLANNSVALTGNKKYAESFTAGHSGKLTRAFIEPWNAGDYILQIWTADSSGLPTGSGPLAFTVVTNPHSGFEALFGTFSSPTKVTAGRNYALVVTVPDANNTGITVTPNNPCPDAFSLNQTGTGAFALDNASPSRDMEFAVWVTRKRR